MIVVVEPSSRAEWMEGCIHPLSWFRFGTVSFCGEIMGIVGPLLSQPYKAQGEAKNILGSTSINFSFSQQLGRGGDRVLDLAWQMQQFMSLQ